MIDDPVAAWALAANRLARRATRRARLSAALGPFTAVVVAVSAAVLGARAAGALDGTTGRILLAIGGAAGAGAAILSARRVPATAVADAAWALDRRAGAAERGLHAALLPSDVARAALAPTLPPAPPLFRLRPPPLLVPALGALLLAGAAAVWKGPGTAAEPEGTVGGRAVARTPAGAAGRNALEAAQRDAEAGEEGRRSAVERAVREALGLPAEGPVAPEDVAERLSIPEARAAAKAAAEPGSPAADALAGDGAGVASLLARALSSQATEHAEALRREAAALRAAAGSHPVPPSRRAMLSRYLAARAAIARPDGDRPR